MQILILGNGGREHALAWACSKDPSVQRVFVAPGNAGTAQEAKCSNVSMNPLDAQEIIAFVQQQDIDLTLIGPEAPLVAGVSDALRAAGLAVFGPSQAAAQLEGSKSYAKAFMSRHGIPTAGYRVFQELSPALAWLQTHPLPVVIKADGLAAGKGVVVAATLTEAQAAVRSMLEDNRFGQAGASVVIEEFLPGEEASFIVVSDGVHALPLATSQDHKRIGEGDTGPNTGGMGAYSPAPVVTALLHEKIMETVIYPTLRGMAAEGHPYSGFLYAGLMISPDGQIAVVEFNCRLGDPETQPILLRLQSSLPGLLQAALKQQLDQVSIHWDPRPALGIVLAAPNYPDTPVLGELITGLNHPDPEDVKTFLAGVRLEHQQCFTAGGRVLCVTALGATVQQARTNAFGRIHQLGGAALYYRRDIGHRALDSQNS